MSTTVPADQLPAQGFVPSAGIRACFSTMGCTGLTLDEVIALARRFQLPCLEIRSLEETTKLPELLAKKPGGWANAKATLDASGLSVPVLGTGFKLVGNVEGDWQELLDFAALADALGAPYLRIFGGGKWGTPLTEADQDNAVNTVIRWRRERSERGLKADILVETHDAFSATPPCVRLNEILLSRSLAPVLFIWDSHHTWRLAGETPAASWKALQPYVRHVHIKDSIDIPSARHPYTYVLPGTGEMPGLEVVSILREAGYSGTLSLEWEKMWHPYLVDLSEALEAARSKGWLP